MRSDALAVVLLVAAVAPSSLGQDAPRFTVTTTSSSPLEPVQERTITVQFVGDPPGRGLRLISVPEEILGPKGDKLPGASFVFAPIPGASTLLVAGEPELPAVVVPVRLAPGETLSVVGSSGIASVFTQVRIAPARELWKEDSTARPPRRQSAVYGAKSPYPPTLAVVTEKRRLRETSAATVVVHPFQYDPATSQVLFRPTVTVKVRIQRDAAELASEVIGYSSAFATAYVEMGGPPTTTPKVTKTPRKERVDYLAVVPTELRGAIQPLLDAKARRGLQCKVLELEKPQAAVPAGETCRAIRTRIFNEYARSRPAYLLLVGDSQQLPTWLATLTLDGVRTEVATDLYYATMDGPEDFTPDLSMGRLPARDVQELTTMIDKILAYEERLKDEAGRPRPEPWGRVLLAAEFEHQSATPNPGTREAAGRYFLRTSLDIASFLRAERHDVTAIVGGRNLPVEPPLLFNDDTAIPATVAPVDPTVAADAVKAAWANNIRLVVHRDHGLVGGWEVPALVAGDVRALARPSTPPIVFSINCSTGSFDDEEECFAEALLRSPNGACAVVAATRPSYSVYNDRLAEGLVGGIWPGFRLRYDPEAYLIETREARRIGPILDAAKLHVGRVLPAGKGAKVTALLFHLFGDPEMHVVGAPVMVAPTEGGPRPLVVKRLTFPSTDPTVAPLPE